MARSDVHSVGSNQYQTRAGDTKPSCRPAPQVTPTLTAGLLQQATNNANNADNQPDSLEDIHTMWDLPWVRPIYIGKSRSTVHIADLGPYGSALRACCGNPGTTPPTPAVRPASFDKVCTSCMTTYRNGMFRRAEDHTYMSEPMRRMLIQADGAYAAGFLRHSAPADPLTSIALDRIEQGALVPRQEAEAARWRLAGTCSQPEILRRLSRDEEEGVRRRVAGNDHCPAELALLLLQDNSGFVRAAAADNPNLPPAARAMWQLART